MSLIPSNMHNYTQQPQIISSSIQMTLIPSNTQNLHSTTSNQVIFNSNEYNTHKCVQLHSTTSNHVLFNSNVHNNTQILFSSTQMTFNSFNIHKCIQPTQINTPLHRICIKILQTLESILITSTCALVYLQCSEFPISEL